MDDTSIYSMENLFSCYLCRIPVDLLPCVNSFQSFLRTLVNGLYGPDFRRCTNILIIFCIVYIEHLLVCIDFEWNVLTPVQVKNGMLPKLDNDHFDTYYILLYTCGNTLSFQYG